MGILSAMVCFFQAFMAGRTAIATENLARRQQIIVLHRSVRCPCLGQRSQVRRWP